MRDFPAIGIGSKAAANSYCQRMLDKSAFGWTDCAQTKAKYKEYWVDGELFLHLTRRDL